MNREWEAGDPEDNELEPDYLPDYDATPSDRPCKTDYISEDDLPF